MADPINLRKARKNKERAEKSARADENRVRFGRTKAEKQVTEKETQAKIKNLDDKRLDK
tara:strand:+ start:67 stop:243 length:177 start_codon:yes stop_codon:yes gene_type:complete